MTDSEIDGGEEIIRIAAKGDGVTASGRFARGAAPGDMLMPDGTVVPGPHHVAPACSHFGRCGGCQLQQLDEEAGVSGGIVSFPKDYSVILLPESSEGYTLKFKNDEKEYPEITLVLDSSFFIRKGSLKNKEGEGFSFTLSGVNFSPDMVKSVFDFNVPANTQIVKNPFNIR